MKLQALGRRFLQIIIVLFGVSFLTFSLTYLAPGDPVRTMYAASGVMPSEEVLEAMREQLGLNRPFLVQYGSWLLNCLQGDFGTSFATGRPVAATLLARLWPTLKLALLSLLLMLVVSLPAGMLAALKQNRWPDYLVRACTFFGVSMPNFWVGLLLIYLLALKLNWLPVTSINGGFERLIMPALTLAFAMSAKYTRQVRAVVLEEMRQDYVIGARCRGLKESTILWRHVFPNALLPLITLLGLSLGSLLGGTAVVETIFSYPGLGSLAVSAITAHDYYLIQGVVLWIALIYMLINLLVDISYNYLDPRLREKRC